MDPLNGVEDSAGKRGHEVEQKLVCGGDVGGDDIDDAAVADAEGGEGGGNFSLPELIVP